MSFEHDPSCSGHSRPRLRLWEPWQELRIEHGQLQRPSVPTVVGGAHSPHATIPENGMQVLLEETEAKVKISSSMGPVHGTALTSSLSPGRTCPTSPQSGHTARSAPDRTPRHQSGKGQCKQGTKQSICVNGCSHSSAPGGLPQIYFPELLSGPRATRTWSWQALHQGKSGPLPQSPSTFHRWPFGRRCWVLSSAARTRGCAGPPANNGLQALPRVPSSWVWGGAQTATQQTSPSVLGA